MRGEISIQAALDEIRSNDRGEPFILQFVRSSGKKKGTLKTVRALYGRSRQSAGEVQSKAGRKTVRHKERGTLPIVDVDVDEYLTPLISHFRMLNGYKIKH